MSCCSKRLLAIFIVVTALGFGGCGYSLAGRGSFLPEYIQTIGIPLFVNQTSVFDIEQLLTQKVRSEFIGRGRYKVLPEATSVDGLLTGTITSITLQPASFTNEQQASRYAITLTANVQFTDVRQNKTLWENPSLTFREEYEVTNATTAFDPSAFFGQDKNALERVSTNFAQTLVSAILEAF